MTKWYYAWRLNKVRAEISLLKDATQARLQDDYTAYSRLRVLERIASNLQQKLAAYSSSSTDNNAKAMTSDLKQTL